MIPSALLDRVTRGEAVVYPTSTQPALGCAPEEGARDRLFELKQRRPDARVSLAVADLDADGDLDLVVANCGGRDGKAHAFGRLGQGVAAQVNHL